jgi:chaperone BCS1
LHSIFQAIYQLLSAGHNQFASGGLLLMAVGAVGAALRNIPMRMWQWVYGQVTLHLTIIDSRDAFDWFKWWFYRQQYSKRARRVDVDNPWGVVGAEFLPAPGRHWFFYKGRPIRIVLTREEGKESHSSKRKEEITLSTFGRDQKFLREIVAEMQAAYDSRQGRRAMLFTFSTNDGYWRERSHYRPRPLNSVVMDGVVKEDILEDIRKFLDSEKWYENTGIPYHRGYLFHGPPGTGKTSLIAALSEHFKSRVYYLRLNEISDLGLNEAMRTIPAGAMIVMEDIDCVTATAAREKTDKDESSGDLNLKLGVTLSGLLNALDGVHSPQGAMYFMTTNHIGKLDPALIRPGRIDVRILLDKPKVEQLVEMYHRFFGGASNTDAMRFIEQQGLEGGCTMAEFQERLLRARAA